MAQPPGMTNAIIYGAISGLSLLLGAFLGLQFHIGRRVTAMFMAFGSGVLICAVTFVLMEEAFQAGGFDAALIGFGTGGLVFLIGDYFLHRAGAKKYKAKQYLAETAESTGSVITLGAILDGVPESVALGVSLTAGHGTGLLMVGAIFLSNLPEAISSVPGLLKEGCSRKWIYGLWSATSLLLMVIVVASYAFLRALSPEAEGIIKGFAAGSILSMLANSMIPEAYHEGGFMITPMTILGFAVSFVLAKLGPGV
jgi:ZIP family zinc transporter